MHFFHGKAKLFKLKCYFIICLSAIPRKAEPIVKLTCADEPCFPGVPCIDTEVKNGTNIIHEVECGPCPTGYRGNGIDCEDIDEVFIIKYIYFIELLY